jgi:hypothetical protein
MFNFRPLHSRSEIRPTKFGDLRFQTCIHVNGKVPNVQPYNDKKWFLPKFSVFCTHLTESNCKFIHCGPLNCFSKPIHLDVCWLHIRQTNILHIDPHFCWLNLTCDFWDPSDDRPLRNYCTLGRGRFVWPRAKALEDDFFRNDEILLNYIGLIYVYV